MNRSSTTVLAAAILATFAAPTSLIAQDQGGYTIEEGNTLWDLAQRFLGDPFEWRTIWEANLETIPNPDLIYPGQVIRIPNEDGSFIEVTVVPQGERPAAAPPRQETPMVPQRPERERTIFYPDTTSRAAEERRQAEERYIAVPTAVNWSAPFLAANADFESLGTITGFSGAEAVRSNRTSAQPFDRLEIEVQGSPATGTRLVSFRRVERIDLGEIVVPTALLQVTGTRAGRTTVMVERVYELTEIGDEVMAAPSYEPTPGRIPIEARGGPRAHVLGYYLPSSIHGPGDEVFLDGGEAAGMAVGDEYATLWGDSDEPTSGIVQIVRVDARGATGRILRMRNAVFVEDVDLVEIRRMPRR